MSTRYNGAVDYVSDNDYKAKRAEFCALTNIPIRKWRALDDSTRIQELRYWLDYWQGEKAAAYARCDTASSNAITDAITSVLTIGLYEGMVL